MKGKSITYRRLFLQEILDGLFFVIPLVVAGLWTYSAVITIIHEGWFTRAPLIPLINVTFHSLTILSATSFFFFTFYCLNYLLPHVRAVLSCALTVFGLLVYDLSWIICDYLVTGSGRPTVQLCLVLATLLVLLLYNRAYRFLTFQPSFLILFGIHVMAMYLLSTSGFFQTLHAGFDPHPGNWLWFVGKFTGIWTWSGIYQKRVKEWDGDEELNVSWK